MDFKTIEQQLLVKLCRSCNELKLKTDFYAGRAKCKQCRNNQNKTYYQTHKEKWPKYVSKKKDVTETQNE